MHAIADRAPGRVVCIGETMLQLAPPPGSSLSTTPVLTVDAAGAESTVALYLAHLGHPTAWLSRLGTDPFGTRILELLARAGVDTRLVERDPERPTGVYFKDLGSGATTVHYYRAGSAASALSPASVEDALAGVSLVHLSGITPALSSSCRRMVDRVVELHEEFGFTLSFDVNHRPGLWTGRDAATELLQIAQQSDVVFVGRDEAEALWGTSTAEDVRRLLPSPAELVVKDGPVGATVLTERRTVFEPALQVEVVEAVGAGDSFAGGYLHARLRNDDLGARLRTGHTLAAAVLGTTADFVAPTGVGHVAEH